MLFLSSYAGTYKNVPLSSKKGTGESENDEERDRRKERRKKRREKGQGRWENSGKGDRIFKTKRLRKRVVKERFGDMRAGAETIKRTRKRKTTKKGTWEKREEKKE